MDLSGLIEAKDLALTAEKPYKFFANRVQMQSNMAKSLLEFFEEDGNFFEAYVSKVLSLSRLKLKEFMLVTTLSKARFIYRLKN